MPSGELIPGIRTHKFGDHDATRQEILDRVYNAYSKKFPVENDKFRIEMHGLSYPDKKYDVRDEKNALLKGNSLSLPLHGTLRMIDKSTNEVMDEVQGVMARVPWLTHRGTYINGGNEYAVVAGQQRLKPGVYNRRKDNGELESFINLQAGTGQGMRLFMEPETGVYRVMVGKSRMRLYPVLKAIGADDQEIEKWWGPELLKANKQEKDDEKTFDKFYTKFLGKKAKPELDTKSKTLQVIEELQRGGIDEDVAERTLGFRQKNINPQVLLRATQKLVNISKGEEEEDDRDSLANKNFLGQEDLFEERINKDVGGLTRKLLSRSSYGRKITGFVNGYFSPQLDGLVSGNSLATHIDGINPIQIADFNRRVVQTGEGAIEDSDAIPVSSRNLNPTQAMAIDPIRTPESSGVGVDQRFAMDAIKGSDRQVYFPLINRKTGKTEYLTPAQMSGKIVGFPKTKNFMQPPPAGAAGMLNL